MSVPYSLALADLLPQLRAGTLKPSDIARDVLAAASAGDAHNVWIQRVPDADVMARARALEQIPDARTLPLYGVPFAVKDNIDVATLNTTAACPAFGYAADRTATAVQRLIDAGAVLIGKTNLDQFATGLVGTRSPYGACKNAFDPAYISGGSSSGSAVAVAMNLVSFALGTDTAGSGRVPAGLNNIVGLKPTRGTISTAGVVPACRTLDCVSVFALTVSDAWQVYEAARGADTADAYSRKAQPAHRTHIDGLKCAIPRAAHLEFCGDAQSRTLFDRAVSLLQKCGAQIIEIDFAPFRAAAELLYQGPWVAERVAGIRDFYTHNHDKLHPVVREVLQGAERYSAVDTFEAAYQLQALKQIAAAQFDSIDAMMVPTAPTVYTIAQVEQDPLALNANLGFYTNFVNLLDLAALAVPGGMRGDGLPGGVTFIAPAFGDALLCELGDRFHRASTTTLGATQFSLPPNTSRFDAQEACVKVAVVGAHLSGMPLNHQLTSRDARLITKTRTAPAYLLYLLPGTQPPKPGLVLSTNGHGHSIEVEIWSMPAARYGEFVAEIPAPLGIGTLRLEDESTVQGFVCTHPIDAQAQDISQFGGWRNYIASRAR